MDIEDNIDNYSLLDIITDSSEFQKSALQDFKESIGANDNDQNISKDNKSSILKSYPNETMQSVDKLTKDDMSIIIKKELERRGIAGHHISSMNSFYNTGIRQIVTEIFSINKEIKNKRTDDENINIDYISFEVKFTDTNLMRPTTTKYTSGKSHLLTPNTARLRDLTYSSPLYVSGIAKATAYYKDSNKPPKIISADLKDIKIADIPVMVGSQLCITHNLDKEGKRRIEEDPRDPGGYFIIKGGEWCVDGLENIHINDIQVYHNMHQKEIARASMISKPGDGFENSFQIIMRYLNNGAITIEITTGKFDKLEIPFYLIFRAFGMTQDMDIINRIVYGTENTDPVSKRMIEILYRSFKVPAKEFTTLKTSKLKKDEDRELKAIDHILHSRNTNEIVQFLGKRLKKYAQNTNYEKDAEAVKFIYNETMRILDTKILPHCGITGASRVSKTWYLGHMINKLLRVEAGVLDSTDRDAYPEKSVHTAGVSMAKTFKTQFNFNVVQVIKKHLEESFESTPFSKVKLESVIKTAINDTDLENVLVRSITSGNKTIMIGRYEGINRISSQILYRKNDLNVFSTLNTINTSNSSAAKQTERSDQMRRVHPTYTGYLDVAQSAESGEKVGMGKQLCISASILDASNSFILKKKLLENPNITPLDKIIDPAIISKDELSKVFVNGDWIGVCKESYKLANYYRNARRHGDINEFTTIVWKSMIRELYFWVDNGRLVRPLVIVYNNIDEYIDAYKEGNAEEFNDNSSIVERINIPISTNERKEKLKQKEKVKEKEKEKEKLKGKVKFQQWTKLKKEHIIGLQTGDISLDYLRQQRVIEYISPAEAENTFIAENYDIFMENQNNIERQFTHCDFELSIFGIVSLSSPFVNHTPATRITMFTNHKKQTCGWFALNWPYRIDKNVFLQYYCETPLVRTFSDTVTNPNGQNVIVAYLIHGGLMISPSLDYNPRLVGFISGNTIKLRESLV